MESIDVAMALDHICPAAQYFGSLTDNTVEAFANLSWLDEREKPTWAQVEAASLEMQQPNIPALSAAAIQQRDQLLAVAALRVAPLQDASDLDVATEDEAASLTAWKRYRVNLNRIEQQEGFPLAIQWPEQPVQE